MNYIVESSYYDNRWQQVESFISKRTAIRLAIEWSKTWPEYKFRVKKEVTLPNIGGK
tara:strand:+ start:504 stop:674 length:171 start_codon:yes stop_codon:yes gene_type:complete